jgi:micrococcal nuclease
MVYKLGRKFKNMIFQNKKLLYILIGILILFIGIGIGLRLGKIAYAPDNNWSGIEKTSEPADVSEVKVVRVIDGDTIEIEGGEKVRYIGIDAPETVGLGKLVEYFGKEATAKNKELVEGKTVRLKKDTTDRDKYNRLLRYVYVGENLINAELVKLGFARAWAYPPDMKYQDQINAAQQEAQKLKSGLWAICPIPQM